MKITKQLFVSIGLIFLLSVQLKSQTFSSNNYQINNHRFDSSDCKNLIIHNGKTFCLDDEKFDESNYGRYIVKFNGKPLVNYSNSPSRFEVHKNQQILFKKFREDFDQLIKKSSTNKSGSGYKNSFIKYEYSKSFYGTAVNAYSDVIESIKSIPYVSSIHKVVEVNATTFKSIPLIGADSVWENLGFTGKNVVIGIIDSGIDYLHPDLGGGFGVGYKVIGGYDFINKDSDPMDDHGHGTHVAGIAAGLGDSIKGVAPDASLFAYKVLSDKGSGYSDDIIAAIEQCIDPNQDGNFEDKLDVVNMSLGGSGQYNDPLSQAVDNASEAGVVFCISAGNSGIKGAFTIGSPGTAMNAITVGASDFNDSLAYFSSLGPNPDTISIKPEVLAPGVNIYSCGLQNNFNNKSGTSMAAPHVAGLCALLKEAHPDWEYVKMKSALTSTAKNLNLSPFMQGAGRIDALKAIRVNSFIKPAVLSYGNFHFGDTVWTKTKTVKIFNGHFDTRTYKITIDTINVGNAALLTCESDTITVLPGDSTEITFTLQVTDSLINDIDTLQFDYYGNIWLTNDTDTLHIPYAAAKVSRLTIDAFEGCRLGTIYNKWSFERVLFRFDSISTINILPGTYNAHFISSHSRFYHISNLKITSDDTLDISAKDIQYSIQPAILDENGDTIAQYSHVNFLYSDEYLVSIRSNKGLNKNPVYVNRIDTSAVVGYHGIATVPNKKIYAIQTFRNGVNSSCFLSNNPNEFLKIPIRFEAPKLSTISYFPSFSVSSSYPGNAWLNYNPGNKPWNGTIFIPKYSFNEFHASVSYKLNKKRGALPFKIMNDSVWMYNYTEIGSLNSIRHRGAVKSTDKYKIAIEDTVIICDGPSTLTLSSTYNNFFADSVNGNINVSSAISSHLAEGELDIESFEGPYYYYKLYDKNDKLLSEGKKSNFDTLLTKDIYTFELFSQKMLEEVINSSVTVKLTQDLRKDDASPPTFTSLKVLDLKGTPTNMLTKNDSATLTFSLGDFFLKQKYNQIDPRKNIKRQFTDVVKPLPIDSVHCFIRNNTTANWMELAIEQIDFDSVIGYLFESELFDFTKVDSTVYDIRIYAYDSAGNKCESIWENCFYVNSYKGANAVNDNYNVVSNQRFTVNKENGVLRNDNTNAFYYGLSIAISDSANKGELSLYSDGSFVYEPVEDYIGTDTFSYALFNQFQDYDTALVFLYIEPNSLNNRGTEPTSQVKCFPNPTSSGFTVETNFSKLEKYATIELIDFSGKKVAEIYSGKISDKHNLYHYNTKSTNGISLPSATYFIKITTDKNVYIDKIVIAQ